MMGLSARALLWTLTLSGPIVNASRTRCHSKTTSNRRLLGQLSVRGGTIVEAEVDKTISIADTEDPSIPHQEQRDPESQELPPRGVQDTGVGSPQPSPPERDHGEEEMTTTTTAETTTTTAETETTTTTETETTTTTETETTTTETDGDSDPKLGQTLDSVNKAFQRTAQKASKTWKQFASREASDEDGSPLSQSLTDARSVVTSIFQTFPAWVWSTLLVHPPERGGGPTLMGLYAGALLGASCGFWLFLYFISLGYAAGIGIPLGLALKHFVQSTADATSSTLTEVFAAMNTVQRRTVLHTALVILWSLRMFLFLVWREYVNWPALHKRILKVNQKPPKPTPVQQTNSSQPTQQLPPPPPQRGPPSLVVKLLCWVVYSFFYLCMLSPSFFRIRHCLVSQPETASSQLSLYQPAIEISENVALALQSMGLVLESIADVQKSTFKARLNCRYEWCGIAPGLSLWKWSTHPNYLGEGLFWLGTVLGGVVSLLQHADMQQWRNYVWQVGFMVVGFAFICRVLQGAVVSLDEKQSQKYGHIPEFVSFRQNHGLFGPKRWPPQRTKKERVVLSSETIASLANDTLTNTTTTIQSPEEEEGEEENKRNAKKKRGKNK